MNWNKLYHIPMPSSFSKIYLCLYEWKSNEFDVEDAFGSKSLRSLLVQVKKAMQIWMALFIVSLTCCVNTVTAL